MTLAIPDLDIFKTLLTCFTAVLLFTIFRLIGKVDENEKRILKLEQLLYEHRLEVVSKFLSMKNFDTFKSDLYNRLKTTEQELQKVLVDAVSELKYKNKK